MHEQKLLAFMNDMAVNFDDEIMLNNVMERVIKLFKDAGIEINLNKCSMLTNQTLIKDKIDVCRMTRSTSLKYLWVKLGLERMKMMLDIKETIPKMMSNHELKN